MKQTILHMMEFDWTKEFQSSLYITTWKRLPIFTKVNTNSTNKWVTTVRSFHLIPDTDGLLKMLTKGITNTARSSDNLKKIKAFMQVHWNLTTEAEIIPKKFKVSLKEHSCYFFQISSSAHLRKSFPEENVKLTCLRKNRKYNLRIFCSYKHLESLRSKV